MLSEASRATVETIAARLMIDTKLGGAAPPFGICVRPGLHRSSVGRPRRLGLLYDLDDPVRTRIDEHRSVIDDRVAVVAHAVLGGRLVILDAILRQHGPHSDFVL